MKLAILLALTLCPPSHAETKPTLRPEDGGLSPAVINAAIKVKRSAVAECYADELERKKSLGEGKAKVKLVISAEGKVTSVNAVSSFANQHIENCLERELKSLTFPRPAGGGTVEVSYPFAFSPADAAASGKTKQKP